MLGGTLKTFEIWDEKSIGLTAKASHVVQADHFTFSSGVFFFSDSDNHVLHAIVATTGMLVRTVKEK